MVWGFLNPKEEMHKKEITQEVNEMLSLYEELNIKADTFPIGFRFYDQEFKPVRGVECFLKVGNKTMKYLSNKSGEVIFYIDKATKDQEIKCFYSYPTEVKLYTLLAGERISNEIIKQSLLKIESGENMKKISSLQIEILYPKGAKDKAEIVMAILKKEREIIKGIIGEEPLSWKVILTDKSGPCIYIANEGLSLKRTDPVYINEYYYYSFTNGLK